MDIKVQFRFNKETGQVEEFIVDDQDQSLRESEHDEIAMAFAKLLERYPTLEEVREARVEQSSTQRSQEPETPEESAPMKARRDRES